MNQKETICPLLTTNTVIGENGQVSIGRDSILEDIYKAIQYEVGHNINRKQAQAVWNYAYEQGHSFGFNSVLNCLYEIMELAEVLLGGGE